MNYCVCKSYVKDGDVNFFPLLVFSADNNQQATEEFLRNRFYKAGTYCLFELKSFFPKDHIVPISPLNHFDINNSLSTRLYQWDENGNFISCLQEEDKQ